MILTGPLLLIGALCLPLPQDTSAGGADAVAELLAERCASCHSPGSDEPKAAKHWPNANDLLATRNSDLIVPGDPDDSDLFAAISFGDMPPPDSDVAPLTQAEQDMLAAWIRDGAKAPSPPDEKPAATEGAAAVGATESGWMDQPPVRWVSHFHPLVVHFPIALFVVALLAEILSKMLRKPELATAATFCLAIGALSALPTAGLGWLLAEEVSKKGDVLFWHRWLGVSTAVFSLLTLLLIRGRPGLRLPLLLLLATLVGVTGHLGGTLSYGASWLDWPGK